ncbi:hypothetical protein FVE85_5148 [Porphyridium purpureum]|uniref:Uncharacterized protein n=1 Tax=Porphyridium purpureum TaxID=35688 RepID=A0A5J4Z3N3_PORPP|nr:hypothetical protein FVE85_5148 [Porphyridium purpureum]|eukprot:POR1126..scf295_1
MLEDEPDRATQHAALVHVQQHSPLRTWMAGRKVDRLGKNYHYTLWVELPSDVTCHGEARVFLKGELRFNEKSSGRVVSRNLSMKAIRGFDKLACATMPRFGIEIVCRTKALVPRELNVYHESELKFMIVFDSDPKRTFASTVYLEGSLFSLSPSLTADSSEDHHQLEGEQIDAIHHASVTPPGDPASQGEAKARFASVGSSEDRGVGHLSSTRISNREPAFLEPSAQSGGACLPSQDESVFSHPAEQNSRDSSHGESTSLSSGGRQYHMHEGQRQPVFSLKSKGNEAEHTRGITIPAQDPDIKAFDGGGAAADHAGDDTTKRLGEKESSPLTSAHNKISRSEGIITNVRLGTISQARAQSAVASLALREQPPIKRRRGGKDIGHQQRVEGRGYAKDSASFGFFQDATDEELESAVAISKAGEITDNTLSTNGQMSAALNTRVQALRSRDALRRSGVRTEEQDDEANDNAIHRDLSMAITRLRQVAEQFLAQQRARKASPSDIKQLVDSIVDESNKDSVLYQSILASLVLQSASW